MQAVSERWLEASARHKMILRALSGESRAALAREYGVSRESVQRSIERARRHPERDLDAAEESVAYWRAVAEIERGTDSPRSIG